jgi:hypothetical protein
MGTHNCRSVMKIGARCVGRVRGLRIVRELARCHSGNHRGSHEAGFAHATGSPFVGVGRRSEP